MRDANLNTQWKNHHKISRYKRDVILMDRSFLALYSKVVVKIKFILFSIILVGSIEIYLAMKVCKMMDIPPLLMF